MTVDILKPNTFLLTEKKWETKDVFTIKLKPKFSQKINFSHGQFNMLYAFGSGDIPISISGDNTDQESYTHTIKQVGFVSKILGQLSIGDYVGVRGPFGQGWPIENCYQKKIIIIAGGLGLAPLMSITSYFFNNISLFDKVALLYGVREPKDIIFYDWFKYLRNIAPENIHITVDYASDYWGGNIGVVTNLIRQINFTLTDAMALICGPEIMMRFCANELLRHGLKESDIYISMERNMKCAVGFCGHCQYLNYFLCKDGPVFRFDQIKNLIFIKEL